MDIHNSIFNLMKSFGFTMKMYDAEGNGPLISFDNAEYFYCFKGKQTYMIVIEDEDSRQYNTVTIYKSDVENTDEFRKILQKAKDIAIKNAYSLTVKNFGRSFTPKDFAIEPKIKKQRDQDTIEESFDIHGSKKTSYHIKERAKVIVRHNKEVSEDKFNARSRNISEVYVSCNGERRKVSETSLLVGKAVANYVNSGGKLFDSTTNTLVLLGNDIKNLKKNNLNETKFPIADDRIDNIRDISSKARKQINKFIGSIAKKKTFIEENDFDFLTGPKFDFTKAYFEALTGEEELSESLARASMFLEQYGQDYFL